MNVNQLIDLPYPVKALEVLAEAAGKPIDRQAVLDVMFIWEIEQALARRGYRVERISE